MALDVGVGKWIARSVHQKQWGPMANGDTGTPLNAPSLPDKTFSCFGTFGSGGSVSLLGNNDGSVTGIVLKDTTGTAITFGTPGGVVAIAPDCQFMWPSVTAGDGTTAINVIITSTKAK